LPVIWVCLPPHGTASILRGPEAGAERAWDDGSRFGCAKSQGVRHAFGGFGKDIARGLQGRCDWGPQYIADAWINEVKWLGITITPSYVGEPQCNGVAERFMRTLKEQCVYLHHFESLEQARAIIAAFIERYNTQWLIERLGHRTPAQARAETTRRAA